MKKSKCSCTENMVQVFGLKTSFLREAGYRGISRQLPLSPKMDLKAPIQVFENYTYEMLSMIKTAKGRRMNIFHLAAVCSRASLVVGGSVKKLLKYQKCFEAQGFKKREQL